MALILFVAELGSGYGHVHRLLPIARAARTRGYDALFIVSNRDEAAACVTSAGFQITAAPAVPRIPVGSPAPGAVATSFADILGGSGFADPDFLLAICAGWDAELARLRPVAIVCESSPFLLLACFGGPIPVLSVGHGFILPPPHLPCFLPLVQGEPLYSEPRLLEHVTSVCRTRQRVPPHALPMLLAGSEHAVTGLDVLDPYRHERHPKAVGPLALEFDTNGHAPSDEVFAYLLGDAPVTLTILRSLCASGLPAKVFVRRGSAAQRNAVAGSPIVWLDQPDAGRAALTRARVVVHHGSMLTAEESLFLGRQQIVVPLYLEHLLTARALSSLGVATVIRPPHDVETIAHQLTQAHEARSMRDAAQAFANQLRLGGGPSPELADKLIASVAPPSTSALRQNSSGPVDHEPLVSFVVPSYQMAPYLALSLESLTIMRRNSVDDFEIVVVDDGSTDETQCVFDAAAASVPELRLRYVHRPRDERSCRSLARNFGAASSRGRYLLFVDAGVMVHPELLNLVLRRWTSASGADEEVLAIGTLGLFASQFYGEAIDLASRFQSRSSSALLKMFDELSFEPAWCERRQAWFDFAGGDLSRLPAP